jgi:hypothetical protein
MEHSDCDTLSPEEISQGWHYCYTWERLLIGPGNPKMDDCKCKIDKTTHNIITKKNDIRQPQKENSNTFRSSQ